MSVVFEQAAEIGGVWKYHEELPTGGGVMYINLLQEALS